MLTLKEVRDIFLIDDLEKLYEQDRKILEVVEKELELYLSEIDNHFESKEKDNIYFNFGFYELVNQLKDEELLTEQSYDNFLAGFEKHQNEFLGGLDFENELERAAFYVERALITKYCTENINALKD